MSTLPQRQVGRAHRGEGWTPRRRQGPIRPSVFDPGLDIATVVFSHVQCVKTRVNLSLVSKLWRDASKPAAAYPLRFDFDAFPRHRVMTRIYSIHSHDGQRRSSVSTLRESRWTSVVKLRTDVCNYAALRGSVRLLKWERVNDRTWSANTCAYAATNGHLPALQFLHENGSNGRSLRDSRSQYARTVPWTTARRPIQTLGLSAVRGG